MSIDDARKIVEETLNVKFSQRNSGYYAGDYFILRYLEGGGMKLYKNYDEKRKLWVREAHKEYKVILEVYELDHMEELHCKLIEKLPDIVLLSSDFLPDDDSENENYK